MPPKKDEGPFTITIQILYAIKVIKSWVKSAKYRLDSVVTRLDLNSERIFQMNTVLIMAMTT